LRIPGGDEFGAVDDVGGAREFCRHPQVLAVWRRREAAWAQADHHVARDRAARRIHLVHEVAGLRGDVDGLPALADQHAFGLAAGRHFLQDRAAIHVDDGE
jgi:hypothetical protein